MNEIKQVTCAVCRRNFSAIEESIVKCAFCGKPICNDCAREFESRYPSLPIVDKECEREISVSCENNTQTNKE